VRTRHLLQLVLLSALWGASFLFIRIASPALGPHVAAALRIGLATLTLVAIMRATREPWPWRHWRELAGLGTLTVALPFLLYAYAALHLPAGYSALLNTMVVPFGVLASAWMKEDTLSLRKWLGCACGFAGVALIVRLGPVEPSPTLLLAALACMSAAACYGVCTPWMKRATQRISPLAIAWLPVVLVRWFGEPWGLGDFTLALVGLAAFLGHLWPVFFRFQGGKGVATALGVLTKPLADTARYDRLRRLQAEQAAEQGAEDA